MDKKKWGGKRTGGGRKPLPQDKKRVQFNVRLHPAILAYLREQPEPVAQLIESALIEKYGIDLQEDTEP